VQPVTINDARRAVNAALDAAFPDIPISGEPIPQNLAPPYFFVKLLEPTHTRELGRRHLRVHPFDVHYFAPGREIADMYDMADQLTTALQQITVAGRPVHGTEMRFQVVDDVLHFFVTYSFHAWAPRPDAPAMQTLNVREGVK